MRSGSFKASKSFSGGYGKASHFAVLSRKIAPFGLAAALLAGLMHRLGLIPAYQLLAVLCAGALVALCAAAMSLAGLIRIWRTGAPGARRSFSALLIASLTLAPFVLSLAALVYYPRVNAVTTTQAPLFMLSDGVYSANGRSQPGNILLQRQAYPQITGQEFSISAEALYALALATAKRLNFVIVYELPPITASLDEAEEGLAQAAPVPPFKPFLLADGSVVARNRLKRADSATQDYFFEAVASTPLLAFSDDIVIRVRALEKGARLDIRSASRIGLHDLGANARRVQSYLQELDLAVKAFALE